MLCGEGFISYTEGVDTIAKLATIGYRARIKGTNTVGFVTAAHAFVRNDGTISNPVISIDNKEVVANCDRNRILFNNIVDAAFCIPIHSGVKISNLVDQWYQNPNCTLATDSVKPVSGMWLQMVGQTSGLISGRVIEPSLSNPEVGNGVLNLKDIATVDFIGQPGDSGGIIFYTETGNINVNNPYKPHTLGIFKGMLKNTHIYGNDTTITQKAMCIKATQINRTFGFELY